MGQISKLQKRNQPPPQKQLLQLALFSAFIGALVTIMADGLITIFLPSGASEQKANTISRAEFWALFGLVNATVIICIGMFVVVARTAYQSVAKYLPEGRGQ